MLYIILLYDVIHEKYMMQCLFICILYVLDPCMYQYVCMYACMYICMYVCMYICMMYVHACMYVASIRQQRVVHEAQVVSIICSVKIIFPASFPGREIGNSTTKNSPANKKGSK